jgi:hypothetical protein
MTTLEAGDRETRNGKLVVGAVLLGIGTVLLAAELGLEVPLRFWSLWPVVPLAIGLSRFVFSADPERRRGGYWLIVLGVWGGIGVLGLFGLGWGSSWPIWLIALGLRVILDGFPPAATAEVRHDR